MFDSFRAQHGKKTESVDLRRAQFQREIAKLSPQHDAVLRHVVSCGDRDAEQLTQYLHEQGTEVELHEAERLLAEITQMTGFLEIKSRGVGFMRYAINPVWEKLLMEWAAQPAAVTRG